MKKWVKYTLIGFGVLLVLNVIIEMTKSPEQKLEEDRQRRMKDSVEKVRKDSISSVGLGVSLKEVVKDIEYNHVWKKTESGTSRLWNRDGMRMVLSGDESNLSFIGVYIKPSEKSKEDVTILSKLITNLGGGEESAAKIISDIASVMNKQSSPNTWTIGDKISLEYAMDTGTKELVVGISRTKKK